MSYGNDYFDLPPSSDPLRNGGPQTPSRNGQSQQPLYHLAAVPPSPAGHLHDPATFPANLSPPAPPIRNVEIDDLMNLPLQSSSSSLETIMSHLQARALRGLPFTACGSESIIAVGDPYSNKPTLDEDVDRYAATVKRRMELPADEDSSETSLQIHVWKIAAEAYEAIRTTGEDQSIMFCGESGSGKSALRRLVVRQLVALARTPKKKSRVLSGAIKMEAVLESFGQAQIEHSPKASRVGIYTEYQFDSAGKMVGVKSLDFLLDRRRVTRMQNSTVTGRNFNIFYELLAGMPQDQKDELSLSSDPLAYNYLGGAASFSKSTLSRSGRGEGGPAAGLQNASLSRKNTLSRTLSLRRRPTLGRMQSHASMKSSTGSSVHVLTPADATRYQLLTEHLTSLGVGRRAQSQLMQVVAAILHLGNITFQDDIDRPNEACTVRNSSALDITADLLGVASEHLETTLTYKSTLVKGEMCSVMLNVEAAERQRDGLARALYAGLFTWMIEHMNKRLCKDEASVAGFISVLDFPGVMPPFIRETEPALFQDFLYNYAGERLMQHVQSVRYDQLYRELAAEGVKLQCGVNGFPNNQEILQLYTGTVSETLDGIFPIIESRQCDKGRRGSDAALSEQLNTYLGGKRQFEPGSRCQNNLLTNPNAPVADLNSYFGIRHYCGHVTYDASDFEACDSEILDADFVTLFRGISTDSHVMVQAPSKNAFAAHLFSSKVGVSTEKSPASTILAARKADRPMRRPSMKRNNRKQGSTIGSASLRGSAVTPGDSAAKKQSNSLCLDVSESLTEVLDTINGTKLWTVFCLRSKDSSSYPGFADGAALRRQVNQFGLPSLVALKKEVSVSVTGMTYAAFVGKYASVIGCDPFPADPRSIVEAFIAKVRWQLDARHSVVFGREKLFLQDSKWRWLDRNVDEQEQDMPLAATPAAAAGRLSMGFPTGMNLHSNSSDDSKVGTDESAHSTVGLATGGARPGRFSRHHRSRSDVSAIHGFEDGDTYSDDGSIYGSEFSYGDDSGSEYNKRRSEAYAGLEMGKIRAHGKRPTSPPEYPSKSSRKSHTAARRNWVCCARCLTWWIPSACLKCCGMHRPEVQMAWREKVALCILIALMSLSLLFFIVGLSWIVCPPQRIRNPEEIMNMSSSKKPIVGAYGKYYDISSLMESHLNSFGTGPAAIRDFELDSLYGKDVSNLFFRVDQWDQLCPGIARPQAGWDNVDPLPANNAPWSLRPSQTSEQRFLHRATNTDGSPRHYVEYLNRFAQGRIGWSLDSLNKMRSTTKIYAKIYSNVYYLTTYFGISNNGFPGTAQGILNEAPNTLDLTGFWNNYRRENSAEADQVLDCLNAMFYIGTVDTRNTPACRFTNWVLVAASIVLVAIIGFKFVAALQFRSHKEPEECDKFVLCLVTAYTESEDELRKTIDSIAVNKYDDKRKLLFIVADGMIVGSGNDRPTPRIVLDILGVDPSVDPKPVAFRSLGQGALQFNLAKVYSGLYVIRGHAVPYIVVVKTGAPHERVKPGNRGKRDSQLIPMRWLNRVHENKEMTPLELELWWQVERVIGVRPEFYEFILMVDADTCVDDRSLNRLVSFMMHDSKVMGLCGETRLSNEKRSWVTMIQVYEYFISHHLAKAFESLFGTVTCLPGCFCMYRIRSPMTAGTSGKPLLVSDGVLAEYSENNVETLHEKNLLSLGEDRFLTTVMLKNFPAMRTSFTPSAKCTTTAPDRWSVLLSQRRRWINSTVHNLLELTVLKNLCGFCCFSMRFIVAIDLIATLVQPASVLYVVYLIYLLASGQFSKSGADGMVFPILSLVLIAAIYGFQVIIFILRREWQHIVWMLIYMLSLPVFSFYIPLYSFWHFDDFSWGNTRVVRDEYKSKLRGGRTRVVDVEPGKFDERLVPMRKWDENRLGKRASYWDPAGLAAMEADGELAMENPNASRLSVHSYTSRAAGPYALTIPPASALDESEWLNGARSPTSPTSPPAASIHGGYTPHIPTYAASYRSSSSYAPSVNTPDSEHPNHSSRPLSAATMYPPSMTLETEIRHYLAAADLMTVTKKQVRDEMSALFGIDMLARREEMNGMIERTLQEINRRP
ncbi:chitin synthase-domain-containing protein [Phlyctochytrium arcticum]|nr:chitin synthase-domain-containing protein [Phlyctochytrium arcticum]